MNTERQIPYFPEMIQEIASEIGATVWLEPEFGYLGVIEFPNGKQEIFLKNRFNINPQAAFALAKDKGYTSILLERFGYSVVEGRTFYNDELNLRYGTQNDTLSGWEYACTLGLPVIVKPNNLSQGEGVMKVDTHEEYVMAIDYILGRTTHFRVERFFSGNDYRIVVLDGEIISAYQRIPLSISGDGISTIRDLIEKKQEYFKVIGRDTIIDVKDIRIRENIKKQGYTLESIIETDKSISLLDNANLSTGGESRDFSESIHPDFSAIAINAIKSLGLRFAGVDIMTSDLSRPLGNNEDYVIIEVNGAPGLDHYISTGFLQKQKIRNMYKKILLKISTTEY